MKYPRILSALRQAKWVATPATIVAIYDVLGTYMRGGVTISKALLPDDIAPPATKPTVALVQSPTTAIIQVHGILGKHLSGMDIDCGGCDVDMIGAALLEAAADPAVSNIVLDFDSPGGVVTGIPELAKKIRAVNAIKPVYGFSASQCCSAAYWLASSCRAMFCTVSADLGSIGVYSAFCDDSEWWKKEGLKLDLIKAGEFKAMGISGKGLSDGERALVQADIDSIYAMFTADVIAGRGKVETATMQGQTFMGASAVAANLADELIDDLESLIAEISQPKPAAG